ncbi:VWA-like domain-containing protein [Roseibacterium beibuensis]|uniref:VWA-like domain-containing protein n=1 Tax=[Roseibacterium] beibuensis TaxID=1193142 RepID=A0ABP9KW14_9RHOB|nr:VWA-like domain-containing protein [Roseibacterium beibuensis]MCS6621934.1 VWA-like domain-containing protein [Roseibacterium beibuensis]
MSIHSTRAATALAHLGEVDPALAVLSLWCRHRDGTGATRTQRDTILYGPGFDSLPLQEAVGLAAHHVLHVALRHSDRQAGLAERLGARFDGSLFGLAADGIINETLLLAGHALPRPAVTLTDLLDEIGEPARSPIAALADWDADRLAMFLHSDPKRAEKAREFGVTRGFAQDVEVGEPDPEGERQKTADWRNQLLRAMEAGRKAGTGIGRLGAVLADISPPSVPWEVHLRGILSRALIHRPHLSHRRPAARWIAMTAQAQAAGTPDPAYQPGMARLDTRPRIAIGLDTSSSIDPLTLSLFLSEAEGITRRTGAEAHLLAFDEEVFETRRLDSGSWRDLHDMPLRTGGGTDFVPVLECATRLSPSILVMLTDLDAPFGPAPAYPVLWAVPGMGPVDDPPFGRVLRIGVG